MEGEVSLQYDFAPMEGLTTYIYRNAHAKYFPGIHQYFAPFIGSMHMSSRDINGILPENNQGLTLIPQILTNKASEFLAIANVLKDYGYDTVNLNLGCPSGTVVAKHRGAGFLEDPVALDHFLEEIFERCPLKISIKTLYWHGFSVRMGGSCETIFQISVGITDYPSPAAEGIYAGQPHNDAYRQAFSLPFPLCANGDIVSPQSLQALQEEFPTLEHVMIGRGLLRRPWLVQQLSSENPADFPLSKQTVLDFHNEILEGYLGIMSGEQPVLYKMKDLWTHLACSFTNSDKYLKKTARQITSPNIDWRWQNFFGSRNFCDILYGINEFGKEGAYCL